MNYESEIKQVIIEQGVEAFDNRAYQDDEYLQEQALELIKEDGQLGEIIDDASDECRDAIVRAMLSVNSTDTVTQVFSNVHASVAIKQLNDAAKPLIYTTLERIAGDITASDLGVEPDITSYDYSMVL